MESTGKITINFEQEGFEQCISVTQYDTGKKVRCNIAGISGNIGAAMVYCKKPSGLETYTDADIVDDHTVEFYITEQMNAETGCAKCQLQLFGEDKSLTSYKFKILVQENMIASSRVTSADDYPVFRDTIEKFTEETLNLSDELKKEKELREEEHVSMKAQCAEAVSAEKSERQAADAAEKAERMQEIEVERARINNLVANNNPTEGNSELLDIRVGVDGTDYGSAGDAVRGQIGSLYEEKETGLQNLITSEMMKNGNPLTADVTKDEDGKITVTTKTNYGRYDIQYKGKIPEHFLLFSKFKANVDTTGFKVRFSVYGYHDSNNLQELEYDQLSNESCIQTGYYTATALCRKKETQADVNRIDIGLMPITPGVTIEFYNYIMFDLDQIYDYSYDNGINLYDIIKNISNKNAFFDDIGRYRGKIDNLLSIHSVFSKKSEIADSAELSEYANDVTPPVVPLVENYQFEFTPKDYYGWYTLNDVSYSVGDRLLIIATGDIPVYFGIRESGSSWSDRVVLNRQTSDGVNYGYALLTVKDNAMMNDLCYIQYAKDESSFVVGTTYHTSAYVYNVNRLKDELITFDCVKNLVNNGIPYGYIYDYILNLEEQLKRNIYSNPWKNKNALFVGDSLTAAKKYQTKVKEMLGINVFNHCKGGVGLVQMVDGDKGLGGDYDNETDASGVLKPLTAEDVSDKDLIVLFGGYNNRGTDDGKVGDCYNPDGGGQSTIAGYMQYCINRIYEELQNANNLKCKLLIVTVDCAGRYNYIDADGYDEYPSGSGRSMETLANIQREVAEHNSILCCDLWHNSGINKHTWNVFGASSNPVNETYSPYELNSSGDPVNETRIKYVKGQSYYQIRNGEVVLEEYTGSSPFPYNSDQLHKSTEGYDRIGECIVGTIIKGYGN